MKVPIKQQRAETLKFLMQNTTLYVMVEAITRTGSCKTGKEHMQNVEDKLKRLVEHWSPENTFGWANEPKPPTKERWQEAAKLAQIYKKSASGRGRPAKDRAGVQGLLTIIEPNGYVDINTGSAWWKCKCHCGNRFVRTAQRLQQGVRMCGHSCGSRAKWMKNYSPENPRPKPVSREYPKPGAKPVMPDKDRATQMANQIMTNISKEIH